MQSWKMFFVFLALTGATFALAAEPGQEPAAGGEKAKEEATPQPKTEKETPKMAQPALPEGVYARFETSLGDFTARLYGDRTPKTVENFIQLTEGVKPHLDPTGKPVNTRLYDNRKIFRVVKGFMFQTGSANDTNRYSPGFTIPGEIVRDLNFTKPGLLAMANSGHPDTAGSQFFVTFGPTQQLNGGYTIFGEVVDGMETVRKIEAVPVRPNPAMGGENSLPLDPPVIKKTTILRIGKDGKPISAKPEAKKETKQE